MIRREFRSEIEALFPVGFAGREFAAYGKISAPGAASPGHSDLRLFRFALVEKQAAQSFQLSAQ